MPGTVVTVFIRRSRIEPAVVENRGGLALPLVRTMSTAAAAPQSLPTLKKRKAQLEEDLRLIETQIYDLESAYVEETAIYGNIIKGWSEFAAVRLRQPPNQRKIRAVTTRERIFSGSSVTAPLNKGDDDSDDD